MKKQFELLKQPFQSKKKFFKIFLIDGIFWAIITALYFFLTKFLSYKYNNYANGQTPEQIKEFLITAAPEQLSAFLSHTKMYLFSTVGSIILFIIIALALFTLSQALIWNLIAHKKLTKRKYLKWFLYIFLTALAFAITMIFYLFIKYIILTIVSIFPGVFGFISQTLNLLYLLAFVFIFFISSYYFTHHQKVFQSLAQTFNFFKYHFKLIILTYFSTLIIAGLLTLILYIIFRFITPLQPHLIYFNLILSLLFLAWLRLYLVKILQ